MTARRSCWCSPVRATCTWAGKVTAFGPDSMLVIWRNTDHQIINTEDDAMLIVAAFAGTGFEAYFPDGQRIPLPWRT